MRWPGDHTRCPVPGETALPPGAAANYTRAIAYLDRILACRSADLAAFVPWAVDGVVVGHVHRQRVPHLRAPFVCRDGVWQVNGPGFAARSAALAAFVRDLAAAGEVRSPLGESYPVAASAGGPPLLQVDRVAVAWLGVPASGVHLNGYVRTGRGVELWLAERSRGKATYPGHLDNLVAGGQSIGMSPEATLVKECGEEAGLAAPHLTGLRRAAAISYRQQDGLSLKADTLICYDLELPPEFVPRAVDGEVERFERLPAAAVAESLRGAGVWKPNSALVALDFLLRHGLLDEELGAAARWTLWRTLRGELASPACGSCS